jgi:hypothetical protein
MFEKKEAHHLPSHMGGPSLHPVIYRKMTHITFRLIWEENLHCLSSYMGEERTPPPLLHKKMDGYRLSYRKRRTEVGLEVINSKNAVQPFTM